MSRLLGTLIGIVMALFPARFLKLMQDAAIENPDAFTERGWLTLYVRAEGLVVAAVCLNGGSAYTLFMKYIGLMGAGMLAFPRQYVEFGNRMGYDGSDPFEWKPGYLPRIRAIGAFLVFLALRARNQSDGSG